MQNRLAALMLALAVTLVSFGSTALVNTTETIAEITEKVFGHSEEMVILADEDYDYEHENSSDDDCYDSTGAYLCEQDYDEKEYEDYEEDYYEEDYEEDYYEEDYDYDEEYDKDEEEEYDKDEIYEYDDEDYYYDDDDYYIDFDDSYDDHYDDQSEKMEDVIWELEGMLWELDTFVEEVYSSIGEEVSAVAGDSLDALEELLEGGFDMLDAMLNKTSDGLTDDELHEFWDVLDYMWDTADTHIRVLEEELGMHGGVSGHDKDDYDLDYFEDYYGGDYDYDEFLEDFDFEDTEDVTRYISDDLMYELVEHGDNPYAQELTTSVMNNLDVLDEDAIKFLEYSAELFDVMADMQVPNEDDSKYDDLKDLYEESFVLLTEDVRVDLISVWTEVRSAVEAGADEATLEAFENDIESLLEQNAENLVLVEGIGYYDVDITDDEWYFDDVQELRDEGVIGGFKDSDGELTGYYGPSEAITKAEMLKLVLEVSGRGESSDHPADTSAIGQWYEGYVAQFENMSMSYGGDWNEPVSRREAAVWISEAMELHEKVAGYSGEFGDVSSSDTDALHFAAVYEYGVFTGDSGTGSLRPDDGMNRAEAAKAIRVAMNEVIDRAAANVDDTLDAFLDEYRD